jgi:tetrahydromethanopterin S-methyltransferase subunit G
MTAKEYLSQIYYARLKLQRLQERRDEIRDRMQGISSPSPGQRVQTSPEDKMSKLMARLDNIDRKIAGQIDREQRLIETIQSQIDGIESPKHRELLSLRYVHCLKWEHIADRMGYTERRVFQVYGEALAEFVRLYKDCI